MNYDPKITLQKERNAEVFQETMRICREGSYVAQTGRRIDLPPIAEVLTSSVFHETVSDACNAPRVTLSSVDVVKKDCIDVTQELVSQGLNPVMLNMASRRCPGGGALNGARAQEETLFRRSNLCVSLYQFDEYHANLLGIPLGKGHYPMGYSTAGIYSGRVMFFRKGVNEDYALMDNPFECAVVSAAAISHPDLTPNGRLVDWAAKAMADKIRNVLRISLLHGHDSLVLGAWGCGAFRNPPIHIAELFKIVINEEEFSGKFRQIRFAIIEDHNSKNANFVAFERVFRVLDHISNGCGGARKIIDVPKLAENNEIIDNADAIRRIVAKKCARCDSGMSGCMGCVFDSFDRGMIPALIDRIFDLMGNVPNERHEIITVGRKSYAEREAKWREILDDKGDNK